MQVREDRASDLRYLTKPRAQAPGFSPGAEGPSEKTCAAYDRGAKGTRPGLSPPTGRRSRLQSAVPAIATHSTGWPVTSAIRSKSRS
jgi:hypothetical protein